MFPSITENIGDHVELDYENGHIRKVHIYKSTLKSLNLSFTTMALWMNIEKKCIFNFK